MDDRGLKKVLRTFRMAADTQQTKSRTFKPGGAASDLDFNSELGYGYFPLSSVRRV